MFSLEQLGRPRILVLGDIMLDRYTWGDAERVSPEAPVIVLNADEHEIRPGGAASVAFLLRHLDADVLVAGVVGNDSEGHAIQALLLDEGIDCQFVLADPARPTTVKHRFVGRASDRHPHQILRVDQESRRPIDQQIEDKLWHMLTGGEIPALHTFDAILITDYLKGVCTESLLQRVIEHARQQGQPVLIDPGRISDYSRYRGATLLKPNRIEAELATSTEIAGVENAAHAAKLLRERLGISAIMITLDRDGLVIDRDGIANCIPTTPRDVYDITGAGDMVLAAMGLCLANGVDMVEAARIANLAAGLEVERFGISPVTRREIASRKQPSRTIPPPKQLALSDLLVTCQEYRRQGKRIVFTNGCFDLLHVGHLSSLEEAANCGDVLIVAINSDDSVRRLKGDSRPVIREQDRATLLAGLACVDHVVIFDTDTPTDLIRVLRPDILIKGGTTPDIVGRELVESYGGRVLQSGTIPGVSTTHIVTQLIPGLQSHDRTSDSVRMS